MTDNALVPHQFTSVAGGFPHGMPPFNGIASGPNTGGDQTHSGPTRSTGMDYPPQQPGSPYYGGQGTVQNSRITGSGPYPKMVPGRPGWPTMLSSQTRGFSAGSMPPQQGSVPTPTLNQLLQGSSGPDLRHLSGYPGPDYGQSGPPKMSPDEFGHGSVSFGGGHPGWAGQQQQQQQQQQRIPPGSATHPSHMMNMERFEMSRRCNLPPGVTQPGAGSAMSMRYPGPNQMADMPQYSPNSQQNSNLQQNPQVQPSPSTTPSSQQSDHTTTTSNIRLSPPQQQQQQQHVQPPASTTKTKKKKASSRASATRNNQQQESGSSDEALNNDVSSTSRQSAGSAGPQSQQRPGSAYSGSGAPAPSPVGSVGSRSNTPASLSGAMIGSPSAGNVHDVQNRIMSPQGHQSQQMMPPPSSYPGPGAAGKMHGMMMQPVGPGSMPQGPVGGMYGSTPGPYSNQAVGSGYGLPHQSPGFPGHNMDNYNNLPNQPGAPYRSMSYPTAPFSTPNNSTSGMELVTGSAGYQGQYAPSAMNQLNVDHTMARQSAPPQSTTPSATDEQRNLVPAVSTEGDSEPASQTTPASTAGTQQQQSGSDIHRTVDRPGVDGGAWRPPGMPGNGPSGMPGNGMENESGAMKGAMSGMSRQLMGMNGVASRTVEMGQFGPVDPASGHIRDTADNMVGRSGADGMRSMEHSTAPDNTHSRQTAQHMDNMYNRTAVGPDGRPADMFNRPGIGPDGLTGRPMDMFNRSGMGHMPGMCSDGAAGRSQHPLGMEPMLRRQITDPTQAPHMNMDIIAGRQNFQSPDEMRQSAGGPGMGGPGGVMGPGGMAGPGGMMCPGGVPGVRPTSMMESLVGKPTPDMRSMRPMQQQQQQQQQMLQAGIDHMPPGRAAMMQSMVRMDNMDRRGPDGMPGPGPPQHPGYGRQFAGYMNPSGAPGMQPPHGFPGAAPDMMNNTMSRHTMGADVKVMSAGGDVYRVGSELNGGEQRRFNGEGDSVNRRINEQTMGTKSFEQGAGGEAGSQLPRTEDFNNTGVGVKQIIAGGWENDETSRNKHSKKQDGSRFQPPMSGGSSVPARIAPSPATSLQEEIDSTSNHSWPNTPKSNHSDVLNRLADMGDEPDRRQLLEQIFSFMDERGTPIVAVPMISKIAVDLYRLYNIVKEHGGMVEVTKSKKWRDVSSALSLGPSSSAGFTLKKNYGKHLFPFECRFDRGNVDPAPLLALLEQPSKKESKKAAAERVATATVPTGAESSSYRQNFSGPSGSVNILPAGVDPTMMSQSGSYGNTAGGMAANGMPTQSQSSGDSCPVQNPFSDGPTGYSRPNYTQQTPGYDNRVATGPYSMRPAGEPFDTPYPSQQDTIQHGPMLGNYPSRTPVDSRFESGATTGLPPGGPASLLPGLPPGGPGAYGAFGANQSRMDKYGAYSATTQGPMQRSIGRPYFVDQQEGFPAAYSMQQQQLQQQQQQQQQQLQQRVGTQPWTANGPTVYNTPAQFAGPMLPERFNGPTPANTAPGYTHTNMALHRSPVTPTQRGPSMFIPRREILFPADCVEATRPNLTKLRRITHRQLGCVDPWRLLMSLKSGLIAESTWSLDVLSILLRDESTVLWFGLQQLPGLVDVLLEHFRRCLIEIFPNDFDELEITLESASMSPVKSPSNRSAKDMNSDSKPVTMTVPRWMVPHGRSTKTQVVEGRDGRQTLEVESLTDKKEWDVFGAIDSALLDWQMGRGDTSVHIQTRFSQDASIQFTRQRFFGRQCVNIPTDTTTGSALNLDRGDRNGSTLTTPVKTEMMAAEMVAMDTAADDKLPVLASEVFDKQDTRSVEELSDQSNGMKLEPPDIVSEMTRPSTPDVAITNKKVNTDNQQLESLKRKWTKDLEEDSEAYERDVQSLFVASDANIETSRRCLSVSNVLRGLSFVPGNDNELARYPGLLAALGRLLLLGHQHPREPRRRLSHNPEDDEVNNSLLADDDSPIKAAVVDRWRWDTIDVLREDTLVIFANIAGQLDLASFPEEICIPILDGLLHWAVCNAACALDPLPSTPHGCGPSPRRLALEALCKLCVTDSNVDLVLATPPFRRIVYLLDDLVNTLSDAMSDQVAREFAVILASSLCAADPSAARAIALRRSAVSAFLGFIEAADRQAQQLVQAQGANMLRDNPEMMGTSIDMLRRAACVIRAVAETADSRAALLADNQQRLLQLSMSPTLDSGVASVVAEVLYLCSQTS